MRVQCQICLEWIAITSRDVLAYPMTGVMFKSIDPWHGLPDPFPPFLTWEDFKCPYGLHRPFIKDNEVMTDKGLIVLEKDGSPVKKFGDTSMKLDGKEDKDERQKEKGYTCKTCKKVYEKEVNLKRHVRMAHKKG